MKIKTISYSKTVQAKQYEPSRLEITAEVDETDDIDGAINVLKSIVYSHLDAELPQPKPVIKPEDF